MFQNMQRYIGTIVGSENGMKGLDLPRKYYLRQLLLRLWVRINVETLGAPVKYTWGPAQFLKRIEMIADGRDTLASINLKALLLKNFFSYARKPSITNPTVGATGNFDFYALAILPQIMPRAIREIDTLLDTGRLSTFDLKCTFGNKDSIFSTPPTAHTLSNIEVEVHALESINLEQKPFNFSVYKQLQLEKEVTVSTDNFQIPIPIGNRYRGFMIEAEVAGEPSDALINEFSFKSGTVIFHQSKWMASREAVGEQFGMESESFIGFTYIDFCPEGRLVDALDATVIPTLDLFVNVTKQSGINYIRIYPDEFILPLVAKKR